MSITIHEVETAIYVPTPGKPGYVTRERFKTLGEVFGDLKTALNERGLIGEYESIKGAEDYFTLAAMDRESCNQPWPKGRIVVYVKRGGSEGYYLHVDVLQPTPDPREIAFKALPCFLGKSFVEDDAWQLARVIADLLQEG